MNIVLWGLETEITKDAIIELEKRGDIHISAWFGEKDKFPWCTHHCFDYQYGRFVDESGKKMDVDGYKALFEKFPTFADMLSRNFGFQYLAYQEYVNLFGRLIRCFSRILEANNVSLGVFHNIPHEGPDYVLYLLCQYYQIPTLIFSQSLFPNLFFYMNSIEEYGDFAADEVGKRETKIPRSFQKELFYMQGNMKIKHKSGGNKKEWNKIISRLRNSWGKYENFLQRVEIKVKKKLQEKQVRKSYKKNDVDVFSDTPDFTANYVYFPLHMQPEMTTSALGGIYVDQLLAIEELSEWIPENWLIFVKENPKQTAFMRGEHFFQRLRGIDKVRCIAREVDTYKLLESAKFVATISGTVGWEAVSGGKCVVVFGKAWYAALPGVFSFSRELSLEKVAAFRFLHEELEKKLSILLGKAANGIVDPAYRALVPTFTSNNNNQILYEFLKAYIEKLKKGV